MKPIEAGISDTLHQAIGALVNCVWYARGNQMLKVVLYCYLLHISRNYWSDLSSKTSSGRCVAKFGMMVCDTGRMIQFNELRSLDLLGDLAEVLVAEVV